MAAGRGTRIPQIAANMPKCLIRVDRSTLIERGLDIIHQCGMDNVTVLAVRPGHMIEGALGPRGLLRPPNPSHATTTSLASLAFAGERMGSDIRRPPERRTM